MSSEDWKITRSLATRIMGWPVATTYEESGSFSLDKDGYVVEIADTEDGFMGEPNPDPYAVMGNDFWDPLTSLDDAWILIDRLSVAGLDLSITVKGADAEAGLYRDGLICCWSAGRSLPRVLCELAIQALDYKDHPVQPVRPVAAYPADEDATFDAHLRFAYAALNERTAKRLAAALEPWMAADVDREELEMVVLAHIERLPDEAVR